MVPFSFSLPERHERGVAANWPFRKRSVSTAVWLFHYPVWRLLLPYSLNISHSLDEQPRALFCCCSSSGLCCWCWGIILISKKQFLPVWHFVSSNILLYDHGLLTQTNDKQYVLYVAHVLYTCGTTLQITETLYKCTLIARMNPRQLAIWYVVVADDREWNELRPPASSPLQSAAGAENL